MTFPQTALAPKVELQNVATVGTWTDITAYVYTRAGIEIGRGRQDESSSPTPSKCSLTLDNRDGRFSPRNPTGPYFGRIGRNTPIRVSVNLGSTRLVTATNLDSISTPDSVPLSIVGDIDLRFDARLADWSRGDQFITKFGSVGQGSYILSTSSAGFLQMKWSVAGTVFLTRTSTVPLPHLTGRQAVRATLDVDNGAAGHTVTFYTAPKMSGTWTQLGAPVVTAGVTSIFNSTSSLLGPLTSDCQTYGLKVLAGIAGSEVANPDFTIQTDGATSFADAAGNTWTKVGGGEITNRRYRFFGEVSAWPVAWDLSGKDVFVSITAAGIRRRLTQGVSPLRSAFYRAASALVSLQAYWPVEDGQGATRIGSGLTGGPTMAITGAPNLASDTTFVASEPLPTMNNSSFFAFVPPHAATGQVQVRLLIKVTSATVIGAVLARVFTSGSLSRYDVVYGGSGGDLSLAWYGSTGALVGTTGAIDFNVDDDPIRLSLELEQVGADVEISVGILVPGDIIGLSSVPVSVPAQTLGYCTGVQFDQTSNLTDEPLGHITVQSAFTNIYDLRSVLDAYAEERAGTRIERLCEEEGVDLLVLGDPADSEKMGGQRVATFVSLIDEAATSDLGFVTERRDLFGLAFRPRVTVYNQHAGLTLAYGDLQNLEPVDDDQTVRNDLTVSRVEGSSARSVLATGALSILPPPDGVGRYEDQVELSLFSDTQLPDQASWRLMQGTIDEPRYPTIMLDLASGGTTGGPASSASLTADALDLDEGDMLVITDPPAWLPPDSIRQIAQGFIERIEPFGYEIEVNCSPAATWDVGVYDQGLPPTRYDSDGATLNAGITSTATGPAALSLVTPAGKPLWTSSAGEFPLNIEVGGELITLSAIAATASPQSATVSARSVNGVVKAHLAGAAVQVADFSVYAL